MALIQPSSTEEIRNGVHLCVDMQRIFSKGGIWETPWMERVTPVILNVVERWPERTIFTRFITPQHPDERPGRWRQYFVRWKAATRAELKGDELELLPEFRRHVPPATVIDKPAYSAFAWSNLHEFLVLRKVETLVITGAETDVCVLSTALDAVDLGYRVVLVRDALCSSSDEGHDALMTMYSTRFSQQISLLSAAELFDCWHE
jgi:nicotinamidase-related amidase